MVAEVHFAVVNSHLLPPQIAYLDSSWGSTSSQSFGYLNTNKHELPLRIHSPYWVQEVPSGEDDSKEEKERTSSHKTQEEREADRGLPLSQEDCAIVLALLKTYTKSKDLRKGSDLHTKFAPYGLFKNNICAGNTLINFYAKCGVLGKAQEVFNDLLAPDTISWNTLIAGYAQAGQVEDTWRCFKHMQLGGFSSSAVTFVCLLKACSNTGGIDKLQELHAQILKNGLLYSSILVGTALIDAYVKNGLLDKAQEVFEELRVHDVVSWTALITGYAHCGYGQEAVIAFEQMQHEGISPNLVTIVCLFKACGSVGALNKGRKLHALIFKESVLEENIVVANSLMDMYIKCISLEKAQEIFYALSVRDSVTWTTLITGLVQHGHDEDALDKFEQMQCAGFNPDVITYASILKACGSIGAADVGEEIHARTIKSGLLAEDIHVGTAVVDMYVKCGFLSKAQVVFHDFEARDIVMWNALILAYAQREQCEEALECFEQMQVEGFTADVFTYAAILMVCCSTKALLKGQELHAEIVKARVLEKDPIVGTGLVDMYAHCDMLTEAQAVFEKLPTRDVMLWNALIRGYSHHGCSVKVLHCFEEMQCSSFSPDAGTCVCVLKACGSIGAVEEGQELHAYIVQEELLEKDLNVSTTLVDMYAKCGLLEEAQQIFEGLQVRDVVSWNVLIVGHTQCGHGEEALNCFEQMQVEGSSPDAATFACILNACSSIGAAYKGQQLYAQIVRTGCFEEVKAVGTALVDMYANLGMLAEARYIFDNLPNRDVVSWNALMVGYAQLGQEKSLNNLLSSLVEEGQKPNMITLIIMLNACSHRGLLKEAEVYAQTFSKLYGVLPTIEHHTCMVDLFCRAGHLHEAVAVIENMSFLGNLTLWHTLLNGCQKLQDLKLGQRVFEHATRTGKRSAAVFVCMSNIYAAACRQKDEEV